MSPLLPTLSVNHQPISEIQCTTSVDDRVDAIVEAFLLDKLIQNVRPGTMQFYRAKLALLLTYCNAQMVTAISQLDTNCLRRFFLWLSESHNPGGCHAVYRAVRTLLNWYAAEVGNYDNPMRRIKAPRLDVVPLDPVPLNTINKLLQVAGIRDKAIILVLLDTGLRAEELLNLRVDDVKLLSGEVLVRRGKGGKPRTVYIGKKTRRAVRTYINHNRHTTSIILFVSRYGDQITYAGLRGIMRRLSHTAGVDTPAIHAFRRTFALSSLRAGVDVYTLQRLMGHSDLQVLTRYLKLTDRDARIAPSVVDNM